ncbi:MAG: FUSC family protein [Chroococcidiopsidaceae cyanobacterium CP_BM_RX_35]|nr:FUSC family protein [Chroococcidiopsidaceae cyanobacterium CP_BM_RX_35]
MAYTIITDVYEGITDIKSLPWDKVIRFTLSVSMPLVMGFFVGQLHYGVVALVGGMYAVNTANVVSSPRSRLLVTLITAVLITGCAELGELCAYSFILLALGVLILGVTAGWVHNSHKGLESMGRFAVAGFLFGANQQTTFGTKLIEIDARVTLAFFAGGVWALLVMLLEPLLKQHQGATDEPSLRQGWQRLWTGQTAGLRFALCYGIVVTLGWVISPFLGIQNPFWVAVTTLFVMRPDSRATAQRTVERVAGTLIGVLLVWGIITLTQSPKFLILCIILTTPLIPIGFASNYTLCCIAITVLVMVMIDLLTLTHGGDLFLLPMRFYSTAVGCGLTIIGTAITYPKLWWRNGSKKRY